ncbi:MAG TPA: lysozyme inhibitor LprI family protein [Thermoanaerobaculia bacterium]|nr:lysozyme inhibitor LprI family protein [Thermoanaerobaculia bacterium]
MKVTMEHPHRSVRAFFLLAGCWLAFGSAHPARGAADEPSETLSLAACQRYATQHYQQASPAHFASIQLLEEDVTKEKYEKKVGGQLIGTVLSGHGLWKDKAGGSSNVRFICLLETPDKTVFVHVMKDGPGDPVDVCWDGFEPGEWGKMTQCLQGSLKREEAALAALLAKATQQAGQSMDKLSAKKTLQESNVRWIKYRDSECDRRQAFVAGRNHPDIGELTCKIRKTAERITDMKFDE